MVRHVVAMFYGPDLAWIHHRGYTARLPALAALLTPAIDGIPGDRRVVYDLGCGDGGLLAALAPRFEARGVELSPAFAELARAAAPAATVEVGSVHEVELDPCRAVLAVGEVLSYGAPGTPDPLPGTLRRIRDALAPGGLLVFDVVVAGDPAVGYRTWQQGAGWAVLVELSEADGWWRREIVTFREGDGGWRRGQEVHFQRLRMVEEVELALRDAGFASVEVSDRYGALALPPGRRCFTARR